MAPAAAVTAVAVLAVGGWAAQDNDVEAPGPTSEEVQAAANEVFERFDGTVLQRDAGSVLSTYTANGAMDACMDRAGFPGWDWSATRHFAAPNEALATSELFSTPFGNDYSDRLIASSASARAESRLMSWEPSSADENAAIDSCLDSTSSQGRGPRGLREVPKEAMQLRNQWWSMIRALDSRHGGDVEAYRACVAEAGVEHDEDTGVPESLAAATPALGDIPRSSGSPERFTEAWQRLLGAEDEVEDADWACRWSVYNEHLDDVAVAVEQFVADHEEEIAEAQVQWQSVVRSAQALGFTGSREPLGR